MKRLFAAVPVIPDKHFLTIYNNLQKHLKTENIRWVSPENLHITLKFFGETPLEKMDGIQKALKKVAENSAPMNIQLEKTGIFGSRYNPRVIWFGIRKNEQFNALAHKVINELHEAGFLSDRQNFVPHLTLGRMRNIKNKQAFQQEIDAVQDVFVQEIDVSSFGLFESKLHPKGVVYHSIEDYKLKA